METDPEDLGLDLFEFFYGFAGFEVVLMFVRMRIGICSGGPVVAEGGCRWRKVVVEE